MSLTVCCFTQDPGARVHALLSLFRPVADEIVVAADSRVGESELAAYCAVADRLLRFRHDGTQRHHGWIRAQCSGDWILRIDGDEVPSAALLEQLPALTSRPDVLQYWLPTCWLYPDRKHWLDELPWWPDYHNRLMLNSAVQRFPGTPHSTAEPVQPARYLDAPLYHLDGILNTLEQRKAKARKYASLRPFSDVAAGGTIGTYYLPEQRQDPRVAPVPPEDLALIDRVLNAPSGVYPPVGEVPVVPDSEVERVWPGRRLESDAYRASITPFERDWRMRAGECRPIFFAIRNEGTARWPWGLDEAPLIRIAYRWLDPDREVLVSETPRSGFPLPVERGETCITPVIVTAPESPGDYVLELDLVHEFERWFHCEARFPTAVIDRIGGWKAPSKKTGAPQLRSVSRDGRLAYLSPQRSGHLGDAATFEVCRRALPDFGADGATPAPVQPLAVLLGGGTPIGRAGYREAIERLLETDPLLRLFMLGLAVEDPLFYEDDRDDLLAELDRWTELLGRVERPTVRGVRSQELLSDLGVTAEVVGDPALLLAGKRVAEGDPQLVGVNLAVAERIWGKDPELLLDQVADFGRTMIDRGRRLRLVPLWSVDVPYMREAARRLGKEVELCEPSSLEDAVHSIAGCGVFVGQRVQSVAISSSLLIPSVMLAYHPKCAEFQAAVGMEDFTLRTDTLLLEDIVDRVEALSAESSRHRERLASSVKTLRERLLRELSAIQADVRSDPRVAAQHTASP